MILLKTSIGYTKYMKRLLALSVVIVFLCWIFYPYVFKRNKASNINTLNPEVSKNNTQHESVGQTLPIKAAFAIYTRGTFRVFTLPMYHNQSTNVYITAETPNVITVEKPGATWGDFFDTLPFSLSEDCLVTGTKETFCTTQSEELRFYLNGVYVSGVLAKPITEGDRLLVTIGSESVGEELLKLDEIELD